ncbi:MAG TPA: hypothetical protein VMN78_06135 [Longimicrobiales bacterium]|nr:hypothetical protein [Longimicrobiales bacterium]
MRISLDRRWTAKLLAMPESGMGYQRVCVCLRDGRTLNDVVALNAEVLELPEDATGFEAADIVDLEPAGNGS